MSIDALRKYDLIYLATPYTKYPYGLETAFRHAAALTARLLELGLKPYSPIAHTHPIAIHGGLDPRNHDIWLPFDEAIMNKADAILVAQMESWEQSYGIAHEIKLFTADGKPVHYLHPSTLKVSDQPFAMAYL